MSKVLICSHFCENWQLDKAERSVLLLLPAPSAQARGRVLHNIHAVDQGALISWVMKQFRYCSKPATAQEPNLQPLTGLLADSGSSCSIRMAEIVKGTVGKVTLLTPLVTEQLIFNSVFLPQE